MAKGQKIRVTTTIDEHSDRVLFEQLEKVDAAARPGLLRHLAVLGAYQYCCIEAGLIGQPRPEPTKDVEKAKLSLSGAFD